MEIEYRSDKILKLRVFRVKHRISLAELAHTSPTAGRCAALESQATDIYQLARPVIGQGESDFRRKITISGGTHHAAPESQS